MAKTARRKLTTSPYVLIKRSSIHAKGAFARKNIPGGARVIEYVGDKINEAEMERREEATSRAHKNDKKNNGAVYCFEIKKNTYIDGNVPYNTAKYINHSCDPNCESDIINGRIWIISLRDIKKGEELSYNYGYNLEESEDHPCECGAECCVGRILDEAYWPKLKKLHTKAVK